jgi:L,D-transpeptidase YbiS
MLRALPLRRLFRYLGFGCTSLASAAVLAAIYYHLPAIRQDLGDARSSRGDGLSPAQLEPATRKVRGEIARLRQENDGLRNRLASRVPKDPYIVVDTHTNHLFVMQGEEVLRQAVCSTGSGKRLVSPDGRVWEFHTPKGRLKVRKKEELPVWSKPDWAFIEEGEKPPPPGSPERFEEAVLGEYALDLGDSYKIHGTIYKRTLGQKVTHGCVRLDDADLEYVYGISRLGTQVYLF